jgi:hypothetical protein
VTLTRKKPRTWLCPKCSHRNEVRTSSRKCQSCKQTTKPKRRVPKHAEVLRDTSYSDAAALSVLIHGGEPGACGVCGKPRGETRNHDRDHDHRTGQLRGLACFHCNRELLRGGTLESLRAAVAYLERVEAWYS